MVTGGHQPGIAGKAPGVVRSVRRPDGAVLMSSTSDFQCFSCPPRQPSRALGDTVVGRRESESYPTAQRLRGKRGGGCYDCAETGLAALTVALQEGRRLEPARLRKQGWQGRWVARVAGRQKVATPSGSRGGKNYSGSLIRQYHHMDVLGLEPTPLLSLIPLYNICCLSEWLVLLYRFNLLGN